MTILEIEAISYHWKAGGHMKLFQKKRKAKVVYREHTNTPIQDTVLLKEIEKVKELGVKFETNVVIGKSTTIDQLIEEEGFEAVFIGSGAGLPKFMGIPGENANGVFSANEYLTRSNLMKAFDESYDTPIAAGITV